MTYFLNLSLFIAFVLGTFFSYLVTEHSKEDRLLIVGTVPRGFQPSQFDISGIPHDFLLSAIPKALTLTVVASMSNLAVAKKFGERLKYKIDR